MSIKERLLRMIGRQPPDPAHDILMAREQELVERIARSRGVTPAEVRAEARRREQYLRLKVRQARRQ